MADLPAPLRRITDIFKNRVIPLDEGHEVGLIARIGDTLPVPIPMQYFLVVIKSAFLGLEAPGPYLDRLCRPSPLLNLYR